MKALGYDQPLSILPFDHRGSFVTKMFGWHGSLTPAQTTEIAAAKQVIYDGFKTAIAEGAPKNKAGILVDEQCIVLGRGEDDKKVREWLTTAAGVKGFIGFAVGRTFFWDPLVNFLAKKISRKAAGAEIARHYREFVKIFERASSS